MAKKEERKKIFSLFSKNQRLKFSEIEKELKIRSNMVAYHLEQMQKEGIIEKKGAYYILSHIGEKKLPLADKDIPIPVLLVAVLHKNKVLLLKRNNRPYKHYWGLIGGKILFNEQIERTAERLVKAKAGLEGKFNGVHAIMRETVQEEKVKHDFMLFFCSMKVNKEEVNVSEHGELAWFSIKSLKKEKLVPSDAHLIKTARNKAIHVEQITLFEREGNIEGFGLKH